MTSKKIKILWFVPPANKGKYPNIGQYRFYKNMPIKTNSVYPYLAALGVTQLHKAGFDVSFLDCPIKEISISQLAWDQKYAFSGLDDPDLIIMEARTPILNYIFEVADSFRSAGMRVALYGDHVTWDPVTALKHCDYVISGGDFDYGALKLAQRLRDDVVAPRVFDAGLVQNLDCLPHVNRDLVPWRDYREAWRNRDVFLYTMSGRGCHYRCKFCSWRDTLWENTVRQRSPEDVVKEFREIYDEYGSCEILDDHDCFDTVWGVKFATQLIGAGLGHEEILWTIQTHSNMINNLDDLKIMKAAGLHLVKLGIESGNQDSLNHMRKGVTVQQHERAARLLKEADIIFHANLMVGWPWETKEEAYHTIEWIKKLDPNQAQFSLLIPYPNTELYDEAKAKGWLTVGETDWDHYDASFPMLSMSGMTPEEVVQLYKDSWSGFYFNRKYILKHVLKTRSFHDLKTLIRGFRSIYSGHLKAIHEKPE